MSSSSPGGFDASHGRLPPSQGGRTPGLMVSSDRKSIELPVCNPTIALLPQKKKKKTLIQSLSLYLKKPDFQPHHRRCLFKKRCRSVWGCAPLISHICCCCLSLIGTGWIVKELALFFFLFSKIYACTVHGNRSRAVSNGTAQIKMSVNGGSLSPRSDKESIVICQYVVITSCVDLRGTVAPLTLAVCN